MPEDGEAVAESSPVAGGSFDTVEEGPPLHAPVSYYKDIITYINIYIYICIYMNYNIIIL